MIRASTIDWAELDTLDRQARLADAGSRSELDLTWPKTIIDLISELRNERERAQQAEDALASFRAQFERSRNAWTRTRARIESELRSSRELADRWKRLRLHGATPDDAAE